MSLKLTKQPWTRFFDGVTPPTQDLASEEGHMQRLADESCHMYFSAYDTVLAGPPVGAPAAARFAVEGRLSLDAPWAEYSHRSFADFGSTGKTAFVRCFLRVMPHMRVVFRDTNHASLANTICWCYIVE